MFYIGTMLISFVVGWFKKLNLATSTKRLLIVLALVGLVSLLAGQQYHASTINNGDTNVPSGDLDSQLTAVGQQAVACGPIQILVCSGVTTTSSGGINTAQRIETSLEAKIFDDTKNALDGCGYKYNQSLSATSDPRSDSSITLGLATCSLTFQNADTSSINYYYNMSVDLNIPAVLYKNLDKSNVLNNTGSDLVNAFGTSHAETALTVSKDQATNVWSYTIGELKNESGNFAGLVKYNMDGTEDLSSLFDNKIYYPTSLDIDKSLSSWTISTSGFLTADLEISWSGPSSSYINTVATKATFCDTQCTLSTVEKLVIHANKRPIGPSDLTSGTIDATQVNTQTNQGTGHVDLPSLAVGWNPDLKVITDHESTWTHNLHQDSPCPADWVYTGDLHSIANRQPYKTGQSNYSLLADTAIKDLVVHRAISQVLPSLGPDLSTAPSCSTKKTLQAHVNKTESTEVWDGQPTITKRSGTGSWSDEAGFAGPSSYSGFFNTIEMPQPCGTDGVSSMCVTTTSPTPVLLPSNVSVFPNTRRDVFADVPGAYVGTYFPDYTVPGYFTIDQDAGKKTLLSDRQIKLLPAELVVIEFWDKNNPNDNALWSQDLAVWQPVLDQAIARGVSVKTYTVTSAKEFYNTIDGLNKGSWVVGLGHGVATGLSMPNGDLVVNQYLKEVAFDKQIKLALLDGCYTTRITSLAETVIGSYGQGLGGDLGSKTGGFNLLQNSYNLTTADLAGILAKLITTCSAPN